MKLNKTPAGVQAISERDKRLTSKMRMLLVTVDGSHTEAELRQIARDIGAPDDAFDQLLSIGLINAEQTSSASISTSAHVAEPTLELDAFGRLRMAMAMMNELASDVMGLKAVFFVLKVEKCGSIEDVLKLLPTLEASVIKARGQGSAAALLKPLKRLIAGA